MCSVSDCGISNETWNTDASIRLVGFAIQKQLQPPSQEAIQSHQVIIDPTKSFDVQRARGQRREEAAQILDQRSPDLRQSQIYRFNRIRRGNQGQWRGVDVNVVGGLEAPSTAPTGRPIDGAGCGARGNEPIVAAPVAAGSEGNPDSVLDIDRRN